MILLFSIFVYVCWILTNLYWDGPTTYFSRESVDSVSCEGSKHWLCTNITHKQCQLYNDLLYERYLMCCLTDVQQSSLWQQLGRVYQYFNWSDTEPKFTDISSLSKLLIPNVSVIENSCERIINETSTLLSFNVQPNVGKANKVKSTDWIKPSLPVRLIVRYSRLSGVSPKRNLHHKKKIWATSKTNSIFVLKAIVQKYTHISLFTKRKSSMNAEKYLW